METRHEFSAPPELLAEALDNPDKFKTKTINALRDAGLFGSANVLAHGRWPASIWGVICTWAEDGAHGYESIAQKHMTARDCLGTMAEINGVRFVWSHEEEDYVVIDLLRH